MKILIYSLPEPTVDNVFGRQLDQDLKRQQFEWGGGAQSGIVNFGG